MKYELIDIDKNSNEYAHGLRYRVKALRDFSDIKAGDVGGFVTSEHNLSQNGDCWVYDDAKMFDNSEIHNDAKMHNNSEMHNNSKMLNNSEMFDSSKMHNNSKMYDSSKMYDNSKMRVNSEMLGNSEMHDNSEMVDNSEMFDNSEMRGNSKMRGDAKMHDNSRMYGDAKMIGDAKMLDNSTLNTTLYGTIFGDIKLKKQRDVKTLTNMGSSNGLLTIVRHNGVFYLNRGCFMGTLEEFKTKAKKEENRHYDDIDDIIRVLFK